MQTLYKNGKTGYNVEYKPRSAQSAFSKKHAQCGGAAIKKSQLNHRKAMKRTTPGRVPLYRELPEMLRGKKQDFRRN
ncbi:MAG TPA: hypothetical protein DCE65_03650, partial [Clostridiales bacterium]|nr:hypothetical protein [Clostridiales bacterium]